MTYRVLSFYYITHRDNLASIMTLGILSHQQVETRHVAYKPIYDEGIVSNRKQRMTPDQRSLWQYANLYLQPRNPMMYRVTREKDPQDIVVLAVKKHVMDGAGVWLTDGNAASYTSRFIKPTEAALKEIAQDLDREFWHDIDGSKRKIMAECLVPDKVAPADIEAVYVYRNGIAQTIRQQFPQLKVVEEPRFFFQPDVIITLSERIKLVDGDMFLSQAQTLTVSVNTVGVMGKGLASRAKYQFPDVYVRYQDLCKNKSLRVGKPALIKRETSLASQLSETPLERDEPTWFILFPTKKHWKENSQLSYIVDGLAWLQEHLVSWGVTSLALPALGCGLGNLSWQQVGPLLCQFAQRLSIPVLIYLPNEQRPDARFLDKAFLLGE